MTPFEAVEQRLAPYASVAASDLTAVMAFIEGLSDVAATTRADVYVNHAVIELENATGYSVGHILFDSATELYRFIPHHDDQNREA